MPKMKTEPNFGNLSISGGKMKTIIKMTQEHVITCLQTHIDICMQLLNNHAR